MVRRPGIGTAPRRARKTEGGVPLPHRLSSCASMVCASAANGRDAHSAIARRRAPRARVSASRAGLRDDALIAPAGDRSRSRSPPCWRAGVEPRARRRRGARGREPVRRGEGDGAEDADPPELELGGRNARVSNGARGRATRGETFTRSKKNRTRANRDMVHGTTCMSNQSHSVRSRSVRGHR